MKKIFFILCFSSLFLDSHSQTGWFRVSDSIPNFQIYKIQFTSDNTGYAVGSFGYYLKGGLLTTTNAGSNWKFDTINDYQPVDICFSSDNTGYLLNWGIYKCKVLKTTNAGLNWIVKDSVGASIFKVKFLDENTGIVTYKYSYARKTTDGGNSWADMYGMLWQEPTYIWCFDADNWIVANGLYYLNKTTNGGLNWNPINVGFATHTLFFINSKTGYTSSDYGRIYKTTNSGYNWSLIDTLGTYYNTQGGCIYFLNSDTGFISTYGIYKTTNAGLNWISQKIKSNNNYSSMSFINSKTGYAAGDYGIIYKTTTGGDVIENPVPVVTPVKFLLYQNYPNPFNPVTKIKFDIPNNPPFTKGGQGSLITIKIYDITGREIATLVNESLQPGTYEVAFDGSKLTSGIYFYRFVIDNFSDTKRMVFIK